MKISFESFFEKIEKAEKSQLPFVVYKKPQEKLISAFVQNNDTVNVLENFNCKGFVFSPFNKLESKIFFAEDECDFFSTEVISELKLEPIENSWIQHKNENEKNAHISLVENVVSTIDKGKAEKIVVSRQEKVHVSNFEIIETFKRLLLNYPQAFVYAWFHPKVGCWMGASPERLVNIEKNVFKTMALAGTQVYKNTENVVWEPKEKKEQQFVTDYIVGNIEGVLQNIKVGEANTVKAGSLLHLRTDIEGELNSTNDLEKLVNILHPTPAVCGLPKDVATEFILKNENYNRKFYTGYLGEMNLNECTNLYVNLRCMQIEKDNISLYVGGGITKDSIPINEWNETVAKAKVMKKVLKQTRNTKLKT